MLHQVSSGWFLQMPHGIGNPHERVWLEPGGVLDLSDPYIKHAVKGQEHKLKEAPADSVVSPIPPVLLKERELWNNSTPATPKAEMKKVEAMRAAAATGSTSGIEAPSIGGKKK